MHTELAFSLSTLYAFLLVLARVSGIILFVPIPGIRGGPETARIILALALTFALFPVWPPPPVPSPSLMLVVGWILAETTFGISLGLAVGFLLEGFQIAAQVLGLQAGYAYASTIDPNSEADSGVLQIISMLASSLLFFALGFDRQVIRIVADSFQTIPPGAFLLNRPAADTIIHIGAGMLQTGLRLAMPVLALMLLIDLALALLGRIQSQLQLLTLAFPVKMLTALALLAVLAPVFPSLLEGAATRTFQAIAKVLGA